METAPLTLAHTHARNAVLETKRSNPVAASEEHDLAAAEFATAAQGTADSEALRVLNLLEQHHKKLGQILKSRHENPSGDREHVSSPPRSPTPTEKATKTTASIARNTEPLEPHPPRLARPTRPTARDLSSSIASNLASARGIPSTRHRRPEPISPSVSAEHAGGRFAKEQRTARSGTSGRQDSGRPGRDTFASSQQSGKPPWAPPNTTGLEAPSTVTDDQEQDKTQPSDAPFQHFYNTFESLISKLSAPLAFAGLPLTTAAITKPDATPALTLKPKSAKAPIPTPALDPIDYSTLISRAALRAVCDGVPSHSNTAESFYVVPTTGGTVSYAEIMTRADRESSRAQHHTRTLSGISEDDFFDAQSTTTDEPQPPNRTTRGAKTNPKRGAALNPSTKTVSGKTMEELALENTALKHLSDTLAKRLHIFELSAQSSSAALAQSIRSLQQSPLSTPENSRDGRRQDEKASRARITELEEILRKSDREVARRKEENARLKETVLRYREKWEKLKEGARARREVGGNGNTATGKGGTESPGIGPPVEPEGGEEYVDER